MHLVICTGTGLVVMALIAAAILLVIMSISMIEDWCQQYTYPKWLEVVAGCLLLGVAFLGLLFGSHEIGCTVIHLIH